MTINISDIPKDFTIGYYLSKSKLEKLKWNQFVELAKTKYNIKCVPIDVDTKDYPDKCPYDIIVHKLTDELSNPSKKENLSTVTSIQNLVKHYPNLLQVDPLENQRPVVDRNVLSNLLDRLNQLPKELNIKNPQFVVINEKQDSYQSILDKHNIHYPVVCKPIQACGSTESHFMGIVFKEQDLHNFSFPLLVQQYVNHDSMIYKVFVIGDYLHVVHRKSMRNMDKNETQCITFDSQKPFPETLLDPLFDGKPLNEPKKEILTIVSKDIQKNLGLSIFGFDVIVDSTTKKMAVVDVNYFPTYGGVQDFFSILLDHIINVYIQNK